MGRTFEVASIKPAEFPSDAFRAGFLQEYGECGSMKPVISGNRTKENTAFPFPALESACRWALPLCRREASEFLFGNKVSNKNKSEVESRCPHLAVQIGR
jgi:hypothetical protein